MRHQQCAVLYLRTNSTVICNTNCVTGYVGTTIFEECFVFIFKVTYLQWQEKQQVSITCWYQSTNYIISSSTSLRLLFIL
jgi:hypothetical protein